MHIASLPCLGTACYPWSGLVQSVLWWLLSSSVFFYDLCYLISLQRNFRLPFVCRVHLVVYVCRFWYFCRCSSPIRPTASRRISNWASLRVFCFTQYFQWETIRKVTNLVDMAYYSRYIVHFLHLYRTLNKQHRLVIIGSLTLANPRKQLLTV